MVKKGTVVIERSARANFPARICVILQKPDKLFRKSNGDWSFCAECYVFGIIFRKEGGHRTRYFMSKCDSILNGGEDD